MHDVIEHKWITKFRQQNKGGPTLFLQPQASPFEGDGAELTEPQRSSFEKFSRTGVLEYGSDLYEVVGGSSDGSVTTPDPRRGGLINVQAPEINEVVGLAKERTPSSVSPLRFATASPFRFAAEENNSPLVRSLVNSFSGSSGGGSDVRTQSAFPGAPLESSLVDDEKRSFYHPAYCKGSDIPVVPLLPPLTTTMESSSLFAASSPNIKEAVGGSLSHTKGSTATFSSQVINNTTLSKGVEMKAKRSVAFAADPLSPCGSGRSEEAGPDDEEVLWGLSTSSNVEYNSHQISQGMSGGKRTSPDQHHSPSEQLGGGSRLNYIMKNNITSPNVVEEHHNMVTTRAGRDPAVVASKIESGRKGGGLKTAKTDTSAVCRNRFDLFGLMPRGPMEELLSTAALRRARMRKLLSRLYR